MSAFDLPTMGIGDDEDQYQPATDGYTGGGADEGDTGDADAPDAATDEEQARHKKLQDILESSISALSGGTDSAGENDPEARWGGTPAIGLSMFQGHRQDRAPVYNARGRQTGFASAPGAPMAHPPDGLIGGRAMENAAAGNGVSSLTPESQWRKTFGQRQQGVQLVGGGGTGLEASMVSGGTDRPGGPFRNFAGPSSGQHTIHSQWGDGSAYVY